MLFAFILASHRQEWAKLVFVLTALVMGIAGLTSVLVINEASKQNSEQPYQNLPNLSYQLAAKSGLTLRKRDYAQLRREGLNVVPVVLNEQNIAGQAYTVMAIDPLALNLNMGSDSQPNAGPSTWLRNRSQGANASGSPRLPWVFYPEKTPPPDLSASDHTLRLFASRYFQAVPAALPFGPKTLVLDIHAIWPEVAAEGLSELWILGALTPNQHQRLRQDYVLTPTIKEDPNSVTDSFRLNLLAMGLLMFIVCLFVVLNALNLMFANRIGNLKVLRQLGVGRRQLLLATLIEVSVIALFASALGTALGLQLAQLLAPAVSATVANLFQVTMDFQSLSVVSLVAITLSAGLLGAWGAAILPISRLNHNLAGGRIQSLAPDNTQQGIWLVGFLLLMLIFTALSRYAEGLPAHFVALACLTLGGCCGLILLLPWLLKQLLKWVPRHMPMLTWGLADAQRIVKDSKIAFSAFFIAVTANIGMNLMVDSFRSAVDQMLQLKLVDDYYFVSPDPAPLLAWIEQHYPEVEVKPYAQQTLVYQGHKVYAGAHRDTSRDQNSYLFKAHTAETWQTFAQQGVLINEQMALQYQLELGDWLQLEQPASAAKTSAPSQLPAEQAALLKRQVAGIYYDYGNMRPQLVLPESVLPLLHKRSYRHSLQVPATQLTDFEQGFAAQVAQQKRANLYSVETLSQLSMATFDKTFEMTSVLNLLTLLVAAISLATSITMIEVQNGHQKALMRALGVAKSRLFFASLGQYLLLALVACLVAVPFGAALSWVLIHHINVLAFYWSYPLVFSFYQLATVFVLAIVVVSLSVILPLSKRSRVSISDEVSAL